MSRKNRTNVLIRIENMTPISFKEKYLTLDVNDFVLLKSIEHEKKKYYQKYQDDRVFGAAENARQYINVPMEELKQVTIKQLQDNIPVWFTCPTNKMWNRKEWVLDIRNYNYEALLNMKGMDRKTQYAVWELPSSHAMSFVGVHLVDEKPVRWKVENTWGAEKDFKQFIVMNDNYFEQKITSVAIHKKYLTEKIKKCLDQEPVIIGVHEI